MKLKSKNEINCLRIFQLFSIMSLSKNMIFLVLVRKMMLSLIPLDNKFEGIYIKLDVL